LQLRALLQLLLSTLLYNLQVVMSLANLDIHTDMVFSMRFVSPKHVS
jgi:hypothetical protein